MRKVRSLVKAVKEFIQEKRRKPGDKKKQDSISLIRKTPIIKPTGKDGNTVQVITPKQYHITPQGARSILRTTGYIRIPPRETNSEARKGGK